MDETKVQIGNDVLLDVGINPDWYISSVGYEYGYEEKAREVTITLKNKEDENKLWRTLGEPIADRKTEPTISKMEQVDKDINVRSKDETKKRCDECIHFDKPYKKRDKDGTLIIGVECDGMDEPCDKWTDEQSGKE